MQLLMCLHRQQQLLLLLQLSRLLLLLLLMLRRLQKLLLLWRQQRHHLPQRQLTAPGRLRLLLPQLLAELHLPLQQQQQQHPLLMNLRAVLSCELRGRSDQISKTQFNFGMVVWDEEPLFSTLMLSVHRGRSFRGR